jgi:uncharacterized membrane protein YjdF
MIENFRRPPVGVGGWIADLVRLAGVVSVAAAAIGWSTMAAGILSLTLPALALPRLVGERPWFDISYGVTVLIAAWSNVLGLYESIRGWDLVVHFACTGLAAAMTYLLLFRLGMLPDARGAGVKRSVPIVLTTAIALALSALWEMLEWTGWAFVSHDIHVGYQDTIGDMMAGGFGGLCAGVLLAFVRLLQRERAD